MQQAGIEGQRVLVQALRQALQRGGAQVALFETHISWVLVAPPQAFKIKKAVRFDFLDCSTLAARRHLCDEELRLNRRLAPQLYEAVVAVTGSPGQPRLGGEGEPIEYAVRMRAFGQDALWSHRIAAHALTGAEIDGLAAQLAAFHQHAARAPAASRWGTPAELHEAAAANMAELEHVATAPEACGLLARLRAWQEGAAFGPLFQARKDQGWIRECHGDLHCGNILTLDGKVAVFDCIEFSDALRWIDVMHDLAFACMDLRRRGEPRLAARLLNGYLELAGDYGGASVLRYYEAQCALVRAKVELMHAAQLEGEAAEACRRDAAALLAAAQDAASPARPALVLMHGLSGSGKSTVARQLAELAGAVQLRSDVERKRMHGLAPRMPAPQQLAARLYGETATQDVYRRLGVLARGLLEAGFTAVIDACSLKRQERAAFEEVARDAGVPVLVVDVRAGEAVMRARIRQRLGQGHDPSDADESVLDLQLRSHEPLTPAELAHTLVVDGEARFDAASMVQALAVLA